MYDTSRIRWLLFVTWLGSGRCGIWPEAVQQVFGPVERLLPLARQVAAAVGPWLLALLDAQRRPSRGPGSATAAPPARLQAEAWQARPYEAEELRSDPPWLQDHLATELTRLVQLTSTPALAARQPGWLEWEQRYWALAVCLVRLGQLYAALERAQGSLPAQRQLEATATHIWQQMQQAA